MPFLNDKLNHYNNESTAVNAQPLSNTKNRPSRYTFQVEDVMNRLHKTIFGQTHILDNIEGMLRLIHADISDDNRPLYVAMFLGPTGVGKTETIRILAEAIYGDREQFCRIDMNTLTQEHYAAALTGAPPGYVGSKDGYTLFDADKIAGSFSKPGIVLFDEIEKADQNVIQTLLNVFDNGKMVISSGEKIIDFRNSLIFMTSNLGSQAIYDFANQDTKSVIKRIAYRMQPSNWRADTESILERIIQAELKNEYTPEFLNRIDDICIFNWLEGEPAYSIVDKLIDELNSRIKKHHYRIKLTTEAKTHLLQEGFNKQYGARSIKRAIRKYIEIPLAKIIETNSNDDFTVLEVTADKKALRFIKKIQEDHI